MTVGRKIAAGFAVALLMLILIGSVSYRSAAALTEASRSVARTHSAVEHLGTLLSLVQDVQLGVRGYMITDKVEFLEPYNTAVAALPEQSRELKALTADNPRQQRRIATLETLVASIVDWNKGLVDLRAADSIETVRQMMETGRGLKAMDELRALVAEMRDEEEELLDARDASTQATARQLLGVILVGTAFAILLVTVAGFLIVRGITGPVRALVEGAGKIGSGILDHRIAVTTSDEIGSLAAAFNTMAQNLQGSMVSVETERQSRARAERLLVSTREAVGRLSAASADILATTTEQAAGTEHQAAALTETSAIIDEVTRTAAQAAEQARGVGTAVQRTTDLGLTGQKAVDESVRAMAIVKEQVEATAETIVRLAEQAQSIGEIITTVTELADQTHLLALNAAIEAARAGEHGKGFAVVAGEIKALADQSKKATAQVRQILTEIQKATNAAVISTEAVTKGVSSAAEVGTQAGLSIAALTMTLTTAAEAALQIVGAVGQQASGMTQLHDAMRNIDQVARQTMAATRQTEQAAQNLNALGTELTELGTELAELAAS